MFGTRRHLLLLVTLGALVCLSQAEENEKEDVISIENKTQKVIRVSTLELPSKQDRTGSQMNSELFQIQTLRPGVVQRKRQRQRQYVDTKLMRPGRIAASMGEASQPALKYSYTPELKAFPKQKLKTKQQKQLHFPPASSNSPELEPLPVQMTPGPYPVYYVVSRTNGRFGKFPIKAFGSPADFAKYLIKSKAEPIPRIQRYESRPEVPAEEGSVALVVSR